MLEKQSYFVLNKGTTSDLLFVVTSDSLSYTIRSCEWEY